MSKFEYWHRIIEIDDDFKKDHPMVKIGLYVTHYRIMRDKWVVFVNLKKGKENRGYKLKYIGRIKSDLSFSEKDQKIKEFEKRLKK